MMLALAAFLGVTATAGAQTTHKLLNSFDVAADGQIQVGGVDANGDIYTYDYGDNTVHKYAQDGTPLKFSGLDSYVIDGIGGGDCLTTPSDCDQVPRNGLFGNYQGNGALAVDPRSSGPGAGYIYVTNIDFNPQPGKVEVFNPTGKFVGELDNTITFPERAVGYGAMQNVTVDHNGHVYLNYCCGGLSETDQWAPVDADPHNNRFVGQLRGPDGFVIGSDPYSYGFSGFFGAVWRKFTTPQWLKPRGPSDSIDFSPAPGPFGDGGAQPNNSTSYFNAAAIDPTNQDVYLMQYGMLEQWDKDNHQIGPDFGSAPLGNDFAGIGYPTSAGFDQSSGHIFLQGSSNSFRSVAELSGPVTIPDVSYSAPDIGHDSFTVHGHVNLDGGPQIDECKIEYGTAVDSYGNPQYGSSKDCDQGTPITSDEDISATIGNLTTESTYHYRIVVTTVNGTSPGADQKAHPPAVLELTTGPATDIDRTSATLTGSLNPDSMPTTYHFEYGLDTNYDTSTPDQTVPTPGNTAVDVQPVPLTELQSGKTYHYRIVATNALGTSYGADRTFQAARPPAISGVRATNVAETSADIGARINPSGYDTTYYFEYGTTPDYGQRTPATPEDIGDATTDSAVTAHLTGLQSGVVYHFRVVATNKWGTNASDDTTFSFFPPNCPNEHLRQQAGSNYLPDCRAYELVSPGEAGAVSLFPSSITTDFGSGFGLGSNPLFSITPQNWGYAEDPSRFAFFGGVGSITGLDTPNTLVDLYVASRTTAGWVTTYPGLTGDKSAGVARPQCDATLSKCLDRESPGLLGGAPPANAPYVFDVSGASLGRLPTNVGVIANGTHFVGDQVASRDFSHFAFSSRDTAFAPGGVTSAPGSAYDNDIGQRTITIISKTPGGDDIGQDGGSADEYIKVPAISNDGSHILMSTKALDGPTRLYMRVGDAVTYDVSRGTGVSFIGMTDDGSKVYFTSNNRLTGDDTDTSTDLYEWNEDGDSLTLLSQGNGQGNSDDCNASWTSQCSVAPLDPERGKTQFGVPGFDDYLAAGDGTIYFYSPEQLDAANPGVRNQRNLYVYRHGAVQYVATLDPGTEIDRSQISPAGDHAAFVTAARLTGYDNAGFREMYTYAPDTNRLECVSCDPSGDPPTVDVQASAGGRFMADDGRAFFGTSDPLVAQDTDGIIDVYEFVEGRAQLITAGTGQTDLTGGGAFFPPHNTGLEAVSHDGVDVYFSTFDTLLPEDHNGEFVKFYDARTGGGFPTDIGSEACAAADECHGPGSVAPARPQVGTGASLAGRGNVRSPSKHHKRKRKARHRHHRKHHKRAGHRHGRKHRAKRKGARRARAHGRNHHGRHATHRNG